jgi:hypothetical protein
MAVDFEAATVAQFDRLGNVPGVNYATRIQENWADQPPTLQPSLQLISQGIELFEAPSSVQGVSPPMWRVRTLVVLYAQSPDEATPPSIMLNTLISAVVNALLIQPGENAAAGARFVGRPPGVFCTTLGGLCAYCRVSGNIERFEGIIGRVAVAHVPIEMLLTS